MKFCIDAGHGGGDIGASFNGLNEADVNLLVALCLEKYLVRAGHQVIQTRSINETVSLSERVSIAENANADYFISLHCNADPDDDTAGQPSAKGEEIWIFAGSKKGRELAETLEEGVSNIFPAHKFRGIKECRNFYVLHKTSMPAVIIEMGFIDNVVENKALSRPDMPEFIAKNIARGL